MLAQSWSYVLHPTPTTVSINGTAVCQRWPKVLTSQYTLRRGADLRIFFRWSIFFKGKEINIFQMWCMVGGMSEVWVDGGVLNDPVHTCKFFKVIKCAEGSSMQEKKWSIRVQSVSVLYVTICCSFYHPCLKADFSMFMFQDLIQTFTLFEYD